MEMTTRDFAAVVDAAEALDEGAFAQLVREVRGSARERERFEELLAELAPAYDGKKVEAGKALKIAQAYYALGDYQEAADWSAKAGDGPVALWIKGESVRALGQYGQAIEAFEQAEGKGRDSFEVAMAVIDCLRRQGELEEAQSRLKRISRVGDIRAEYHYQMGRLHEASALWNEAMGEYERAIALDGQHIRALFALAYLCDLYGDESLAIDYYSRCVTSGTVHVSALLNLAVLYEDDGQYEQARNFVLQVLAAYPNHERARLFLKDIESSMTMYYDEDQERRVDRRNQVLQIPISDFELSVRSRNCLKKMNIRTLGDLLRVTEAELLAYKNFGETSLQEIKAILTQKGLRLGQLLEDRNNRGQGGEEELEAQVDNQLLGMPVGDLALSVRARKCLQRLNIATVGDLTQCTEAELLGCKNFGMTSLQEITERLTEQNLGLRKLEE